MTHRDILIVGAGPAGLSAGLHLQRYAPHLLERTLILEQAHHPRPKLCAGGVLPSAECYLRELGLDLNAVPSIPVREMVLQFAGRSAIITREPAVLRIVHRETFDSWLAKTARERGLTIHEGVRVRGVQAEHGAVSVKTDAGNYYAQAVVGADGSRSVVRGYVAGDRHRPGLGRAVETRRPDDGSRESRRALFDFTPKTAGIQGYLWSFPTPSNTGESAGRTWGVYDSSIFRGRSRRSLKEVLEKGLEQHGQAAGGGTLQGHPVRWFSMQAALAAPHIVLAGDAAGTDPVVGEGISFALGYGQVAAAALCDAFARDDLSFASYRNRVLHHRIGRYLRRRVLAARLLYGVRSRPVCWLVWPLVGWLASSFFIDWQGGEV